MTRIRLQRLAALPWLLFIAGCSGSPEEATEDVIRSSPPPTPITSVVPEPTASDVNRPIVLAFGDSLTSGHQVPSAMSYPSQLSAQLEALGYDYQVVNDGESGLTTSGGLARLDRALALEAEIVVLALGGNDGLRGTPIAVAHQNLRTLIGAFTGAGSQVVLGGITLPRNYGPDYISDFENMYTELVEEFEVGYIPFFLEGLVDLEDPTATVGLYMQTDGIHPTSEGYTIVAETVFRAIEPHLVK